MKIHAVKRGYQWELSEEEAKGLMDLPCHYCGQEPSNVCKSRYGNGDYYYSGIDRMNNSIGYEPTNVVPCCFECNKAKGTRNYTDFIAWLNKVLIFRSKKGDLPNRVELAQFGKPG